MNNTIRILSIELQNFKNVENGKIDMPSFSNKDYNMQKADILGIYGQNGSGKTAVIEALCFIKCLLSGKSLPENAAGFINKASNSAVITLTFYIYDNKANEELLVNYRLELAKADNDSVCVAAETISYKTKSSGEEKWSRISPLIDYNIENEPNIFKPQKIWDAFIKTDEENFITLSVIKKLSIKCQTSFLFSHEFVEFVEHSSGVSPILHFIIKLLQYYFTAIFFIVSSQQCGAVFLVNSRLTISVASYSENHALIGGVSVSLTEPNVLLLEPYNTFKVVIENLNKVIPTIIPGMTLKIKELGKELDKNSNEAMRFEFVSLRDGVEISLRYESEGIKKILSILSLLIAVYSNPSVCLVVDEFDNGIFEFLLGELLEILAEDGKGQLIFTSHNLRPLETLDKNSIIFTTSNPKNRYIHLKNVKSNNNMRDFYMRSINLGGQREEIYKPTNQFEISRALRKAGETTNE